jgi:hypothetical protein
LAPVLDRNGVIRLCWAIGWIGILHYHLSAWWMLVPVIIIGSVYSYFYPQRQQ